MNHLGALREAGLDGKPVYAEGHIVVWDQKRDTYTGQTLTRACVRWGHQGDDSWVDPQNLKITPPEVETLRAELARKDAWIARMLEKMDALLYRVDTGSTALNADFAHDLRELVKEAK